MNNQLKLKEGDTVYINGIKMVFSDGQIKEPSPDVLILKINAPFEATINRDYVYDLNDEMTLSEMISTIKENYCNPLDFLAEHGTAISTLSWVDVEFCSEDS